MDPVEEAKKICRASQEELEKHRRDLNQAALDFLPPILIGANTREVPVTIELKVDFLSEGDLVDVFEFFVCEGSAIVVSEKDVRLWIRRNIPDVIARHSYRRESR